MCQQLRTLALGLAVVAGLALASPAPAGPMTPLKGSGEGQIILQIDPTPEEPVGVQVYVVEGNCTRLGKVTGQGTTYFTADGDVTGSFVATAADGSTIEGNYTGSFAPIPDTTDFRFEVETVWGPGTRRLAGMTGQSDTVAIVDGLTGAFDWEHLGVWIRP